MLGFQKDTGRVPKWEPREAWQVFIREVELPQQVALSAFSLLMPGVGVCACTV